MCTLQSVELIQNTYLQLKPVEAAEGILVANREDTGAAWLATAVLAGAGVAERREKKKKIKPQTFLSLSFIVLYNREAGLMLKI